jgi:PAS domain S-box-containing protein
MDWGFIIPDFHESKELLRELNLLRKKIAELEELKCKGDLIEEESELKTQLLDAANDPIFLQDFDGNFVYINESAYKTLGYTKDELMKMNLHDLDVPESSDLIKPHINDLIKKDESSFETAHYRKDGSVIPVEIRTRIIQSQNRKLVLSNVRDITERKRIENSLQEDKSQLEAIFSSMVEVIDALQTKGKLLGELTTIKNTKYKFSDKFSPIMALNQEKQPTDTKSSFLNTTKERKIERKLEKSEALFRTLTEISKVGIFMVELDGKYSFINDRGCEIIGLDAKEILKLGTERTIHPDDSERVIEELNQALKHMKHFKCEYRYHHLNGSDVWVIAIAKPNIDASGRFVNYVGTLVDINEHQKAEEKVIKTLDELNRSNKELEHFAYVVSHDLQEPLRSVSNFLQLLSRRYKGKIDPKSAEYIDIAVHGANRMQTMINDLLTYSRITTHGKKFSYTDCQAVLDDTLRDLNATIEENDAIVTNDPLPTVFADNSQMKHLFQNLIVNGIKFHGEKQPKIHISVVEEDKDWLFIVQDNGIGIDSKYAESIFDVFKRLHTRKEYSGTGIGLSICRKIVNRHGGEIWIESNLGEGSKFYFTIPKRGNG